MIVALLSPGEYVTAVMSGAASSTNPTYQVQWRDLYNGAFDNVPVGSLNGATPVTLVPASSGPWQREVEGIKVFNADNADVTVTIAKVVGGTSYTIAKVTLQPGDHLDLSFGGMIVNNSAGAVESVAD